MNTKKTIFLMSALVLLACSCQDDEMTSKQPAAVPGEEVRFGGMLGDGATTRTIYGEEGDGGFSRLCPKWRCGLGHVCDFCGGQSAELCYIDG